jgi:hypothetical protein
MSEGGSVRPSPTVGKQLRRFFLELLADGNLAKYQSREQRDAYIARRRRGRKGGYLGPRAVELLQSDDLWEIQAHVNAVTGSGNAVVLLVVCPPM